MYECPNCGGNLKFSIEDQLMKCDYCQTTCDPYSLKKEKDAEEAFAFEATIFTCPQCGGEILSTDNSAAEFCSFCGASTILSSRLSNEKRPVRIIPFQMTEDACKKAYLSRMRRALFAPKELKQEKALNQFRGIYIPFYTYHVIQKGNAQLKGTKQYRKGDYDYTDHYRLTGDIDASYSNLSFDASSTLDDTISRQIAPYQPCDEKQFTPAFLSGFYADISDIGEDVYIEDAKQIANNASMKKIREMKPFKGLHPDPGITPSSQSTSLCTKTKRPEALMYPVWFMSYRHKDRVAYATINGQTGKISADIPIDPLKYLISTLLLAVLLFFLLNPVLTLTPTGLLVLSAFLSAATFILFWLETRKIYRRDTRLDDKGYQDLTRRQAKEKTKKKAPKKASFTYYNHSLPVKKEIPLTMTLGEFWTYSKTPVFGRQLPGFLGSVFALVIAIIVLLVDPVSDIWYYGGCFLTFLCTLTTMAAILLKFNTLATRPLPQFTRKGDDK